jgi:hypothetical protein
MGSLTADARTGISVALIGNPSFEPSVRGDLNLNSVAYNGIRLVKSARGAIAVFRRRFLGPVPEPGVPVIRHRALHKSGKTRGLTHPVARQGYADLFDLIPLPTSRFRQHRHNQNICITHDLQRGLRLRQLRRQADILPHQTVIIAPRHRAAVSAATPAAATAPALAFLRRCLGTGLASLASVHSRSWD